MVTTAAVRSTPDLVVTTAGGAFRGEGPHGGPLCSGGLHSGHLQSGQLHGGAMRSGELHGGALRSDGLHLCSYGLPSGNLRSSTP